MHILCYILPNTSDFIKLFIPQTLTFKSKGSPINCLSIIVMEWQETKPQTKVLYGSVSTRFTGIWKRRSCIGTTHKRSKPSSVNVPVWKSNTKFENAVYFCCHNHIIKANERKKWFILFENCLLFKPKKKWRKNSFSDREFFYHFFKISEMLIKVSKKNSLVFFPHLIKTNTINRPRNSDRPRRYTKNPFLLQPHLRIQSAHCHSSGQRWRHHNCDQIKRLQYQIPRLHTPHHLRNHRIHKTHQWNTRQQWNKLIGGALKAIIHRWRVEYAAHEAPFRRGEASAHHNSENFFIAKIACLDDLCATEECMAGVLFRVVD